MSYARRLVSAAVLIAAACAACGSEEDPVSDQQQGLSAARKPRVVRQLERAAAGLWFTSEADYPLQVVYFPGPLGTPTAAGVASLTGHSLEEPLVEQTLEEFFATATTPQPWHSPEQQETVRRYQELVRMLTTRLRDVHVFRFGALDIDAYVVGVTSAGAWVGVSTHLVQT
jgi:hypothetical protein